jgi:hypothetical protein
MEITGHLAPAAFSQYGSYCLTGAKTGLQSAGLCDPEDAGTHDYINGTEHAPTELSRHQ